MYDVRYAESHLQLCYTDPSVEPALHLKGRQGACEAHIHSRIGYYFHCADGMDTADGQRLTRNKQ